MIVKKGYRSGNKAVSTLSRQIYLLRKNKNLLEHDEFYIEAEVRCSTTLKN